MKTIFPHHTRRVSDKARFVSQLSHYLFHSEPYQQVLAQLPECVLIAYLRENKLHIHALCPKPDMILIPTTTLVPVRLVNKVIYRRSHLELTLMRAQKRLEDYVSQARAAFWIPDPAARERMQEMGRPGYVLLQEYFASKSLPRSEHLVEIIQHIQDSELVDKFPSAA